MPQTRKALKAGADLSAKQFYVVKTSAANKVNLSSAGTDNSLGALQNAPVADEAADVPKEGEEGFVILGGNVTAGDKLTSDANGKAVTTTTTKDHYFGRAVETGVANDIKRYTATDAYITA